MRRVFAPTLLGIVLTITGIYLLSNLFLAEASSDALGIFTAASPRLGLEVSQMRFDTVKLTALNSVTWKDMNGRIEAKNMSSLPSKKFDFSIQSATVTAESFPPKKIIFKAKGLKVVFIGEDGKEQQTINGDSLKLVLEGNFSNPKVLFKAAHAAYTDLLDIVRRGRTKVPIQFEGQSRFMVLGKPVLVSVGIEPRNGYSCLIMNKNDLLAIAELMRSKDETLTEAEVDILAVHPHLAPRLLRIANYSHEISEKAKQQNFKVPQDAYRHILWSYLLTREFGESFAKMVTDAHEETPNESAGDRRMDYNNNALGRQYAKAGYPETRILERVLHDSKVIRSPR